MDEIELKVEGMSCEHCSARVHKALSAVDGVREVSVALEAGRAVVRGSGLGPEALTDAVAEAGYSARPA